MNLVQKLMSRNTVEGVCGQLVATVTKLQKISEKKYQEALDYNEIIDVAREERDACKKEAERAVRVSENIVKILS